MIGAAMTGARWTFALTRVPRLVFDRLNAWAWWAFDDSGKPMPRKARRAAGAATLILAVAAVGASAMHWLEPQRAAVLWCWFSILAIAASAFQASHQIRQRVRPPADPGAPTAEAPFWLGVKSRARAMPQQACDVIAARASKGYAHFRRTAADRAASAWAVTCRAGKAVCRTTYRTTRRTAYRAACRAAACARRAPSGGLPHAAAANDSPSA